MDLDLSKKYVIIGASKCGTTSFARYLGIKGYDVEKLDGWFWQEVMIKSYAAGGYQGRVPLLVLRDPVERAWSHYHYMFQNKPVEDTDEKIKADRLEFVSRRSYYTKWIHLWLDAGLDECNVYWYEDLCELEDFPHENKTLVKPELDDETRDKIESFIVDEFRVQEKHSINLIY